MKNNKGFSLVELIVVIAIMAILIGVAVPVYSSYVEKSQKAADIQLVDEIKHALQIAAVGNNWYTTMPGGGLIGTISITESGITLEGTNKALIDNALRATFGNGYADNLSVSYDGWSGHGNFSYVAGSSFILNEGNVEYLMGDIEELANVLQNNMDMLSAVVGDPFKDYCEQNGLTTNEQKANGAVTYIATNSITMNESQKSAFVAAWSKAPSGMSDDAIRPSFWAVMDANDSNLSPVSKLAASIARIDALACYTGCDDFKLLTTSTYSGLGNVTDVDSVFEQVYNKTVGHITKCTTCTEKTEKYFSTNAAENDANAYLEVLKQIKNAEQHVLDNADMDDLYKSEDLLTLAESILSVSSDGNIVIVVTMDVNGVLKFNVCPFDN